MTYEEILRLEHELSEVQMKSQELKESKLGSLNENLQLSEYQRLIDAEEKQIADIKKKTADQRLKCFTLLKELTEMQLSKVILQLVEENPEAS